MVIEVELDSVVFRCNSPRDAVEVARLWKQRKPHDSDQVDPEPRPGWANYFGTFLQMLRHVQEAGSEGVDSKALAEAVGIKIREMGTLGAMGRRILDAKSIKFQRALIHSRRKIAGKETKLWKPGPDLGEIVEKLENDQP